MGMLSSSTDFVDNYSKETGKLLLLQRHNSTNLTWHKLGVEHNEKSYDPRRWHEKKNNSVQQWKLYMIKTMSKHLPFHLVCSL